MTTATDLQLRNIVVTFCVSVSVVLNEGCNVVVNSEELIGITECLVVYVSCHMNWCHYNWV
jgi:hypothetical protein